MLIRTTKLETDDTELFSKETPLLPSATELAYHTINCSALNVEELQREDGIEVAMPFLSFFLFFPKNKGFKRSRTVSISIFARLLKCKNPYVKNWGLINFLRRFAVFILKNIKYFKSNHISNKRYIKINMIQIYNIMERNYFA